MSEHWRPEAQPEAQPDGPEPGRPISIGLAKKAIAGLSVAALATSGVFLGGRLIGDTERQRPDPAADLAEDAPTAEGVPRIGNEFGGDREPAEYEPGHLRTPEEVLGREEEIEEVLFIRAGVGEARGETAERAVAVLFNNLERALEQLSFRKMHHYIDTDSIFFPPPGEGTTFYREMQKLPTMYQITTRFRVLEERKLGPEGRWFTTIVAQFTRDSETYPDPQEGPLFPDPDSVLDGRPRIWSVELKRVENRLMHYGFDDRFPFPVWIVAHDQLVTADTADQPKEFYGE